MKKADFYEMEWKEEKKLEGLEKNWRYEQRMLKMI